MMKAMKALILVGLLATATLTFAATADDSGPMAGTWLVTIQTAQGPVSGQAELTVDENHITGTIATATGQYTVDGVFDSAAVKLYVASTDGPGMSLTGTRTAGAVSGTAASFGGDEIGAFVAQRKQ